MPWIEFCAVFLSNSNVCCNIMRPTQTAPFEFFTLWNYPNYLCNPHLQVETKTIPTYFPALTFLNLDCVDQSIRIFILGKCMLKNSY